MSKRGLSTVFLKVLTVNKKEGEVFVIGIMGETNFFSYSSFHIFRWSKCRVPRVLKADLR